MEASAPLPVVGSCRLCLHFEPFCGSSSKISELQKACCRVTLELHIVERNIEPSFGCHFDSYRVRAAELMTDEGALAIGGGGGGYR